MVVDPKDFIKPNPITFTHRIVEGFRDPAWMKYWLRREEMAGSVIPTGYGIAWKCWNKDAYVIMPIPLNILTSWFRALWYAGIHGYTLDALAKAEEKGYQEGLVRGKELGHNRALREVEEMMDRRIKEYRARTSN